MVEVALLVLVLVGTIVLDTFYLGFRRSKIAERASKLNSMLGRALARVLLAICLPGAMFCAAALYMRSWDQSAAAPLCLALFIGGSVIGAMSGLRQRDATPSPPFRQSAYKQ